MTSEKFINSAGTQSNITFLWEQSDGEWTLYEQGNKDPNLIYKEDGELKCLSSSGNGVWTIEIDKLTEIDGNLLKIPLKKGDNRKYFWIVTNETYGKLCRVKSI